MMRSMHIIGSRQFGGAESFYLRLVRALKERNDQEVFSLSRPGSPVFKALQGSFVSRLTVPMRNGWDLFSTLKIRRLVREVAPDIVQTYMGRGTRLTRLPQKCSAVHVARLGGFYKIGGYYRHADAWVGNTRELCDYLVGQGLPADRVFHIGNFVELPAPTSGEVVASLRQSLRIPENGLVVFSLGRFIGIKGFDDLLSAFALLSSEFQGRPLYLVIAGDGPLREPLREQANSLGLEERLRWAGWQSDPGPFFDLADLFVCPSTHETLGNVILEAWAHQKPVLSTSTPGAVELIREGENGLLAPVKKPGVLAARLAELLRSDPADWCRLVENGRTTLVAQHSKEAVLGRYLAMYEDLKKAKARGRLAASIS